MKRKIFLTFKILLLLLVVSVIVFGVYCYFVASGATLNAENLKFKNSTLKIYDKNGEEIRLLGYDKSVEIENVPQDLIDAFVCIEDKKFFEHNGVDALRILKATAKNLISFNLTGEGASTITQQLIKNTHLSGEKTVERKIQEIKLALELEKTYTKEEILQSYFNVLYFGNSIYGVVDASYSYFGKEYTELSLSECAVLAGVIKSPLNYSPMKNYNKSLERRNLVLKEMYQDGFIEKDEYISAVQEDIVLQKTDNTGATFISAVIDESINLLGISENELAYGGYQIYTDYDANLQKTLEENAKNANNIPQNKSGGTADVCAIVANNDSGLISAYYGNLNTLDFYRQPGSTIKPFVSYLPSLSDGTLCPSFPVCDERRTYGSYSPKNYGDKYVGWTNARTALSKSINTVAVDLMNSYGIDKSIGYAQKFGLSFEENDYTLATALGGMTKGVTLNSLTSAYMTLANGGYYKKVGFIKYITNNSGEKIINNSNSSRKIEKSETCYLMTDMLYGVVENGTATLLKSDYKVASKTGTVQNAVDKTANNDLWNVSFTSQNTVCVWIGNASNSPDYAIPNGYTASVYPTKIARRIYDELYKTNKPQDIVAPEGVVSLPYSIEAYEVNHTLILANEFFTKEEVRFDIFDSTLLPNISEKDVYVDVYFDDLKIEITQGKPIIYFTTQKGIKYTVMRCSLLNDWEVVTKIIGDGNTFIAEDDVIGGNDYVYKIEAYVENYAGERKYIKTSDDIMVSVPYDLWV